MMLICNSIVIINVIMYCHYAKEDYRLKIFTDDMVSGVLFKIIQVESSGWGRGGMWARDGTRWP